MEKNRLQRALEEERLRGQVLDLIDTNFHRNGFLYPAEPLERLISGYVTSRMYDPDSKGALPARRAIRDFYGREGIRISEDHILITASASESYDLLFSTLAAPGDRVLLPNPGYPLFEYLAEKSHLQTGFYRLDPDSSWRIDLESVEYGLADGVKFVVLISPNNPTGAVTGVDELQALLGLCSRHGAMLITDEVFSDFLYTADSLPRPAALESDVPVFTINGISKLFACPDLKLSWIALSGPPAECGRIAAEMEIANDVFLSANSLSQYLLPGLFSGGTGFRASMREELARRRGILLSSLSGSGALTFTEPAGGIHCVIHLNGGDREIDDEEFALGLLGEHRVFVHPGYFYGIEDTPSVVVSFLKEAGALQEGILRLRAWAETGQ